MLAGDEARRLGAALAVVAELEGLGERADIWVRLRERRQAARGEGGARQRSGRAWGKKIQRYCLATVFFIPAASWILALSWISLVEYHVLFAVPLLDEPLPDLIAYEEEISFDVRRGMIFGEAEVDSASDIYGHLVKALVNQGIACGRKPMKVPLWPRLKVADEHPAHANRVGRKCQWRSKSVQ